MGRRCCITGCNSTSRLPEHHGVTYHSFPLDATIRAVWIRNTRLNSDRQITKSVLVCSRHFRRVDFQPQRSGKYLLKQRVFPTVFPWGKVDPAQVEADLQELKITGSVPSSLLNQSTAEDATKATVEATVAQIMAETAELNAAAAKTTTSGATTEEEQAGEVATTAVAAASPATSKFEPVTSFNPGARLEAQDFDGVWHSARVVEVDNDDREVLIKFERTGKTKSAIVGTEEWIPMNSTRLRQKVSTKPIPVFELEEKCMARWQISLPRKFPGTVKKILGNDMYEVLFDDGYVKNVRAVHMIKVALVEAETAVAVAAIATTPPLSTTPAPTTPPATVKAAKRESPVTASTGGSSSKKRAAPGARKDWPLLDMSKLDLASLNLPDIPHDGEWTCHWVNDQPIGREGFLIVGEHRKPTVIVDDWRLPPGWVKHMYQRSNVLGKWDVILVTPSGKRFRSKSDLKSFLEEQGQVYNPDIYDFSIHRRRAKDINAYVFTPDYTPQQTSKPKTLDVSAACLPSTPTTVDSTAAAVLASGNSQYIETPVATDVPPMELMTPSTPTTALSKKEALEGAENLDVLASTSASSTPLVADAGPPVDHGFAYIGGLKVQIIDNLFRCPQEGCNKNFRKENHLQIHVKHYHTDLIKLLGDCPKMQELAEKRTHINKPDQHEPLPKNQIPNQQFFAKLHQQDLEQTRAHRRSMGTTGQAGSASDLDIKAESDVKMDIDGVVTDKHDTSVPMSDLSLNNTTLNSSAMLEFSISTADDSPADSSANLSTFSTGVLPAKRARFSPNKRAQGSRKSNRQRTTRRYLTAAQATSGAPSALPPVITADASAFGVSDFEETRHSFNATPDVSMASKFSDARKRKSSAAPATPLSSVDSPMTADSGSSSFQPLLAPYSNDADGAGGMPTTVQPQYIKENGELIKIVRMRQEEIINCLCSYGEEDGLMIQCELCLCWQHGFCNGIDKESDVPEKYVCYICRNPQRGRHSMRFKHDQDWLYEGNLPVANYHIANPNLPKRFDFLNKSHVLTGNLVELKRFLHSLRVKINIANNRAHPKLYLWAKQWDEEPLLKTDIKDELGIKHEMGNADMKKDLSGTPAVSPSKKIKSEPTTPARPMPNIPQPEAPIDPVECQHRLLDHIQIQQSLVMSRLSEIEREINELDKLDELPDLQDADDSACKDTLATFIKELEVLQQMSKLNALENTKEAQKNPVVTK